MPLSKPAWANGPLLSCLQVINIPNSMTVLPEVLPYSIEMVRSMPLRILSPPGKPG